MTIMGDSADVLIVCQSEEEAKAEAESRDRNDPDRELYTWRWLRQDDQWIAKRYPRPKIGEAPPPAKQRWLRIVIDAILDGLSQSGH